MVRAMRCDPIANEGSDYGDGMDAADKERGSLEMRLILPTTGGQHKHLKRIIMIGMRVILGVESVKFPMVSGLCEVFCAVMSRAVPMCERSERMLSFGAEQCSFQSPSEKSWRGRFEDGVSLSFVAEYTEDSAPSSWMDGLGRGCNSGDDAGVTN